MKNKNAKLLLFLTLIFCFNAYSFSQENKIVSITVSGDGQTKQEALQVALRNAIEQAFGTFISSNTQILNDELVKDEIVSVSNGNIQEYTVISEVQTPDGLWSNTVKAKVAVDKLTSFCESKGVNVEFKGSLFALNVKQQILNEENELMSVKNMCKVLKEISENSFDYQISAGEPTSMGNNDNWMIPISITAKTNANFKIMSDYLSATLNGLSLTIEEVNNYTKLEKDYNTIVFCPLGYQPPIRNKRGKIVQSSTNPPSLIYLRNQESMYYLIDLMLYFRKAVLNFSVINELGNKQGDDLIERMQLKNKNFRPIFSQKNDFLDIFTGSPYSDALKLYNPQISNNYIYELGGYAACKMSKPLENSWAADEFFPFLNEIDINSRFSVFGYIDLVISFGLFNVGYTAAVLSYEDRLTLEQLGKISGYKIETIK